MSAFISLLASYYLCSSVAISRPLSVEEATQCAVIYQNVKEHFASEGNPPADLGARIERNKIAYASFKEWESNNPEIVNELKRMTKDDSGSELFILTN